MKISVTLPVENDGAIQIEDILSITEALAIIDQFKGRTREPGVKTVEVIDAPPPERISTIPAPVDYTPAAVKDALQAYANSFGMPAARSLLADMGVARASELDAAGRTRIMLAINEALK